VTREALIARLQEALAAARDVDIAVSFVDRMALLDECALAAGLEAAIGREVDLVDVDTASTLLRWEVLRTGTTSGHRGSRGPDDVPGQSPHRVLRSAALPRSRSRRTATRAGANPMVRVDLVRDKIRRLRDTGQALLACLPGDPGPLAADRDAIDLVAFQAFAEAHPI
jgi:hypothetical protein